MNPGGLPSSAPRSAPLPAALRAGGRLAAAYLPPVLLLAALVLGWEAWVRTFDTRPYILPSPSRIWQAFLEVRPLLPAHLRTTLGEALLGLLAAAIVGIFLAAIIASVALVRRVVYPLLVVSQTIPMLVLAPLLVVWFGFGITPKVIVVALIGFFPIVVATVDGLTNADRDLVGLVRSMGANRLQVLRHVLIPAATPAFFAGLKIASAYAVAGAVIGEWVGASSGLGIYITRSQTAFRTDRVFVGIVVVALLSIALFALVHLLARVASPWLYATKEEES